MAAPPLLLTDHNAITVSCGSMIENTGEYENEGSFELQVSVMHLLEKVAWILRSYIEAETVHSES